MSVDRNGQDTRSMEAPEIRLDLAPTRENLRAMLPRLAAAIPIGSIRSRRWFGSKSREIAGLDLQPCGGTHVRATGEIGAVRVTQIEKKGKQNRRVRLALA